MAGQSLFKRMLTIKVLGASLGGAAVLFLGGIVAWGGFNTVMEATNTLDFCISCHEMENTVYQEYKQSVHYENRTGVRAICSDCHVPHPWVYKIARKIQASNEILHKLLGSISTPEKFEAKRPILAANEWRRMKDSNSRECRNCHSFTAMSHDKQKKRAGKQHETAVVDGQTCIDCHKGIAHRKPNDDGSPLPTWAEYQTIKAKEDEAKKLAAEAAAKAEEARKHQPATAAAVAPAAQPAGMPAVDWSKASEKTVTLFYPGQTSWEWINNGPDHGGARAFKKGEKCSGCHEGEQESMGTKMATGQKAETAPIPGKPPAVKMTVRATHDAENLYMQFSWAAGPHTPAPSADGGKMDPENAVKLALMIDAGKVEDAERSGCWSTCHHDAKSMPDASGEVTKYLPQTRTALSIKDSPRGGADKLKDKADLDKLVADGVFLDLLRWKSGKNESEDGYVSAQRVMSGGQGVSFSGSEAGGTWTVTMVRKLKSDQPGDVSLEPGKTYTVGFALHDDYTNARFHHVSVDYSLSLDNSGVAIPVPAQ